VTIELAADDVIHSFWVPSLAGKMDLIPGRSNVMSIVAERTGVYRGQCAEYCGYQHAHMAVLVIVEAPDQFEAWRNTEMRPAVDAVRPDAVKRESARLRDTDLDGAALDRRLAQTWRTDRGVPGWLSAVDHKVIGRRYIVTAFVFLCLGGLIAVAMRIQLARP